MKSSGIFCSVASSTWKYGLQYDNINIITLFWVLFLEQSTGLASHLGFELEKIKNYGEPSSDGFGVK